MRIGVYQSHIIWEDKVKNIEKLKDTLASAMEGEIDMLLMPEMSFTGFSMDTDITAENERKTVQIVAEIARDRCIAIGFGWIKKKRGSIYNCYTVIDRNGEQLSEYAKVHPFFCEQDTVTPGNELQMFSLHNISFSTAICYDLRFPEIFRMAALRSHVVLVPANWPAGRREHWITLLKARAIENQVYVIGINCVGEIGDTLYSGDSCVVAPDGEIRLLETNKEGLFIHDMIDDVDSFRESFPVMRDSRWKLYRELYEKIHR